MRQVHVGDDSTSLARLVADSSARVDFWTACPRWASGTARREVEDHLVVWTRGAVVDVPPVPAVVARHFDGVASLGELAEDLADAAALDLEAVRPMVAALAVELVGWGAIEGVSVAAPTDVDGEGEGDVAVAEASVEPEEYVTVDPQTGADIRVEVGHDPTGRRVVTEHLPDGRRRVTTEFTFTRGADAAEAAEDLAGAVLSGERSAAELVPIDSCLGAKLRSDDSTPMVSVRCPDGRVRSIRCHDTSVADALRAVAGDRVAAGERGPVEAFVVTPLEGAGPLRIYDGRGRRHGRPRSVADAVAVVDQLLGEASARGDEGADAGLVLSRALVVGSAGGVLVHPDAFAGYRARKALRRAGWSPSEVRAVATADGRVAVPSAMSTGGGTGVAAAQVRWHDLPAGSGVADLVPVLAGEQPTGVPADDALDRLIELARVLLANGPIDLFGPGSTA